IGRLQPRQTHRSARPVSALAAGRVLDFRLVRSVGVARAMGHWRVAPPDPDCDRDGDRGYLPGLDESANHAALRAERRAWIAGQVLRGRAVRREQAAYCARRSTARLL